MNPGSIAKGGYLETVLAIAVDGYLGSLSEDELAGSFSDTFGNTFMDTMGNTFEDTFT